MLMWVCLHEVVHKILILSFQLQEGQKRKTILLAKVTLTTSIIGPALHFCDTVPLRAHVHEDFCNIAIGMENSTKITTSYYNLRKGRIFVYICMFVHNFAGVMSLPPT